MLKSQFEALDRLTASQQQWTTNFSSTVETHHQEAEEDLKQIDGRLERLVQDENNFVNEEITKNVPTGKAGVVFSGCLF